MKKITAGAVVLALILCLFAGCSDTSGKTETGKISVVCTTFPQYDWVKNILGDRAEDFDLTLLLDSGTDLHSYQPTAPDIIKITSADLFIYVGGESDKWVDEVFSTSESGAERLSLLSLAGASVVEEETVEGMEAEEEHEEEAEEGPEYDEHVWLSLRNAGKLCEAIRDALIGLDGENAQTYTANAEAYIGKLDALDKEYAAAAAAGKRDTLLFADRFPFRYLTEDYDLTYYAAFSGCSGETEASFDTVSFLAKKTDELDLPVILVTETSDRSLAQTVASSCAKAKPEILVMDAMQSVTRDKVNAGESYLDTMQSNLEILKTALG